MKDKRSHTCKVNEDSYIKKSHVWAYKKRPMHLFIFLTNSKYTILLSTCIFHVELYFDLSFKLGSTFSMNWGFENNNYALGYVRLQLRDKKILGMAPLWIIHLSNGISCLNFQQLDWKRKKKKLFRWIGVLKTTTTLSDMRGCKLKIRRFLEWHRYE